jgi:hypothetical protein
MILWLWLIILEYSTGTSLKSTPKLATQIGNSEKNKKELLSENADLRPKIEKNLKQRRESVKTLSITRRGHSSLV